ncbi:MAG TPA: stressosome-associated protein Prli42 [Paenibacillus sp.]
MDFPLSLRYVTIGLDFLIVYNLIKPNIKELLMQRKKWFRVVIYLMLIAMLGSSLLMVFQLF